MKVVILAGGLGTRIAEESHLKPKPMIEIGSMPILLHIIKNYVAHGFNEFIICAGYKQQVIKEYFANFYLYNRDVTFEFPSGDRVLHSMSSVNWKVTVVDTGLHTHTGGRIDRVREYIGDEPFMLTYGDAVGDVDLSALLETHKKSGKIGTMTCYNFGQSKGVVEVESDGTISTFREKSDMDGDLINIGFMVMEPEIFDYIDGQNVSFEKDPLKRLAEDGQLGAYIHRGFWQCMDTVSEKERLERLWEGGNAPWKMW